MKKTCLFSTMMMAVWVQAFASDWDGLYIYGHEVNSFQPCGKTQDYWISGSSSTLQTLQNYVRSNTSEIY